MKKVSLILIAVTIATMSFGQSLAKISNYKTDSITELPLQEVVTNFYIDWGVNSKGEVDSTSQIIIVNVKQFVMSPDTTKVILQRQRSKRINQGTSDFSKWFNSFDAFGNMIYQELTIDSIQ